MFRAFKCDFKTNFLRHQGERQYTSPEHTTGICPGLSVGSQEPFPINAFWQPLPHMQLEE